MKVLNQPIVCVDIETDGASWRRGHVIEVAAIRIENGEIVDEFTSLVNPGVEIPSFITGLTGIDGQMLVGEPEFADIADRLLEITDGAIFVAHNVRFDYSFLKEEFRRAGLAFEPKLLCTVKLSRVLHPEAGSHKLSSLIERHNFSYSSRHRAYDDAYVVWQFLQYAERSFDQDLLRLAVSKQMRLPSLPRGLSMSQIDSLPTSHGVYMFKDADGNLLYIGKSVNIRRRVLSHFASDHSDQKEFKLAQQVHDVTYQRTGGELAALLLESQLIKQLQPVYNRRLRRTRQFVAARIIRNDAGYDTLEYVHLETVDEQDLGRILAIYPNRMKAKSSVLTRQRLFKLCPKLCGLEKASGSCFSYQLRKCSGACIEKEPAESYNARLLEAFEGSTIDAWPYDGPVVVREVSIEQDYGGFVVDKWRIIGTLDKDSAKFDGYDQVFDHDAYKILRSFLRLKSDNIQISPYIID